MSAHRRIVSGLTSNITCCFNGAMQPQASLNCYVFTLTFYILIYFTNLQPLKGYITCYMSPTVYVIARSAVLNAMHEFPRMREIT